MNELVKQAEDLLAYEPPFVLIPVKLSVGDDGRLNKIPVMKWSEKPIPEKDLLKKLTGKTVNGLAFDLRRSGLVVIDVDAYKEACNWYEWVEENGVECPATWKVRSGSGGVHYIFANPDGIQLRGHIAGVVGVDIKSAGIEIIPPSMCGDREYIWMVGPDDMEEGPAPIPQWLIDECAKGEDEGSTQQKVAVALSMREPEQNIDVLSKLLAVKNSGVDYSQWLSILMGLHFEFHDTAFEDEALNYLLAWTRTRVEGCNDDDIAAAVKTWKALPRMGEITAPFVTVASVYHFIKSAEKLPMPEEKVTELEQAIEAVEKPAAKGLQRPERFSPTAVRPRPWVLGTDLIKGEVSALFAAGGSGKSSLVILQALSIATGRDLMGCKVYGKRTVWLWNGEDGAEELARRVYAAMQHYGITEEDLGGRLIIQTGDSMPINIAYETPAQDRQRGRDVQKVTIDSQMIDWIVDTANAMEVEVVMFDPFINTHQLNENDNVHVNIVMQAFKKIARDGDLAVQLVHHVAKGTLNGKDDGGSADAARGATSFINASRVGMALQQMSRAEATLAEVKNETDYVKLIDSKANLAARRSQADVRWFKKVSVPIGNGTALYPDGDEVAVMERFTMTVPMRMKRLGQMLIVLETLADEIRKNDSADEEEVGFVFKNIANGFWAGWKVAEVLDLPIGEQGREDGRSDAENTNRELIMHLLSECVSAGYLKNTDKRMKANDGKFAPVYTVEDDAFSVIKTLMKS